MTLTAQTIVQRGMKLHADLDSNVETLILSLLGTYLDKLWSIYDINQAAVIAAITINSNDSTVAMPTDLLRVDSITYDNPYQGTSPLELTPKQYNYAQSYTINYSGSPPEAFWPDYTNREFVFVPVPTTTFTGKVMYYPQYATIAAATDLQFFPLTRLLELFAYLAYASYDRVQPDALYAQEFKEIEAQLTFKYWSGGDPPSKDGSWYNTPSVAIE